MRITKALFISSLLLALSASSYAGGIKVKTTHKIATLNESDGPVALVESILIKFKKMDVFFASTDETLWNWEVKGNKMNGHINLFVSKEHGIGWMFYMGEDTLKVVISTDHKGTHDPRLLSLTSTMNKSLYYIENVEPDCNSGFAVYELKDPADSDIEYEGEYALEINTKKPCSNGQWKVKTDKQKVFRKIQAATIFTAMMSLNIRYLMANHKYED